MDNISARQLRPEKTLGDPAADRGGRVPPQAPQLRRAGDRSPDPRARVAGHVVRAGQRVQLHQVLPAAEGDGRGDVRDGGPREPEEREARDPDPAGGGQEGRQDRDAGADAGAVRAGDRPGTRQGGEGDEEAGEGGAEGAGEAGQGGGEESCQGGGEGQEDEGEGRGKAEEG